MGDRVKGFCGSMDAVCTSGPSSRLICQSCTAERMAPVVDLPGRKPNCWSEMVTKSHTCSFSNICLSRTLLMIGKVK